jgi:hypothetical protein
VHGWEFVTGKTTGEFGFQVAGSWTLEVFQVERGSMYQLSKKVAFGGAVSIKMGVTGDSFT